MKSEENHNINSEIPLATYCNSSFLKAKRKIENAERLKSGCSLPSKVIKIDESFNYVASQTTSLQSESEENADGRKINRRNRDISCERESTSPNSASESSKDLGPRVEIVNGQIVLRESSLMIANQDVALAEVEAEYEEIEEGVHASSRYSSFLKKQKSTRWSIEETRKFYRALQQCGTEFSVMESFLPNRTRKELKMKFFREEKQHPELVKKALEASLPLDLEFILEENAS